MQKSYHYIALLKAVMRLSLTSLKAADVKDIASSVTAIANEKLKAEKEATTKKKTGKHSATLSFLWSMLMYILSNKKIETRDGSILHLIETFKSIMEEKEILHS